MNVQYIDTPAGRFAVVPEAEFLALAEAAEDAGDIAVIREFERKLTAGEEELLSSEIVKRFLVGENKIRVWREHRGMSAAQLAMKAGISPAFMSQIEGGQRRTSVMMLKRLAGALGVTMDDLA